MSSKILTDQSATLFNNAATKPIMLKLNSVQLVRANPPTTGINDKLMSMPVCFLSTIQLITTVKNGAADFIVSVKDTATYARLTRDNTTLRNLKKTKAYTCLNSCTNPYLVVPKIDMVITNAVVPELFSFPSTGVHLLNHFFTSLYPYILAPPITAVKAIW